MIKLILGGSLLLLASAAFADKNGTFSTGNANVNGSGAEEQLRDGVGAIFLDGDFGAGNINLQIKRLDGVWSTIKTYTAKPSPNPERIDIGSNATLRVTQDSATDPVLYWEIRVGPRR